jgi:ABC-type branched-subunit amino acid transport system ATPase component
MTKHCCGMAPILSTRNIKKKFGELQAVDDVCIDLDAGDIKGIIGPNGSGKTTFLNLISGLYRVDEGSILFQGKRIEKLSPYRIASIGVGRTFQVTQVFRKMSVLQNMLVGGYVSNRKYNNKAEMQEIAMELLALVGLQGLTQEPAQILSGGQQKLLELVRVLITAPKLLLLDEPFAGVNEAVKQKLFSTIKKLNNDEEISCLIVSHDLPSIRELCHTTAVLSTGKKIADGETKEILLSSEVIESYLGEKGIRD